MIDKFIKINTATNGPVLVNALDISSVINKGSYTQLNVGSKRYYTVSNIPAVSGTHTALEVASGTTTSDGTGGYPPQLIDSNATFTSSGMLPGDLIVNNPVTQPIEYTNAYESIGNVIVNDTTLNVSNFGLASGVDYKIYSSNFIFDPNADFIAAGVQQGMAVNLTRGFAGSDPVTNIFVDEVSTNKISLLGAGGNPAENYGADWQVLAAYALGLEGANEPVSYKIFNPELSTMQAAINAAIVDVLNNATSHVAELPFVVDEFTSSES